MNENPSNRQNNGRRDIFETNHLKKPSVFRLVLKAIPNVMEYQGTFERHGEKQQRVFL